MSGSENNSQSVTIKTEPGDSFQEDSYNVAPVLNNKSDYLPDFSNRDPRKAHSKIESMNDDGKYPDCNFTEIREKLKTLKGSDSEEDPGCSSDFKLTDFFKVEHVEMSDSYEMSYHSSEYNSSYSRETSNLEDSEDRKPSQEELEMISEGLQLKQPTNNNEHMTVVTSVGDDLDVGKMKPILRFSDGNLYTPQVTIPQLSMAQLFNFSGCRYVNPSVTKKMNNGMKFIESEIMKPVFNDNGVITSYQCVQCSKNFNKRQTLRQHFITHTDRFACPYCVARCKSKGDLQRHIQTHTKEKPVHCKVCNTNYARPSILKRHMRTQRHRRSLLESKNVESMKIIRKKQKRLDSLVTSQAGIRQPLSCMQCQKVFLSVTEYRKHIRSHTLKFICDICQKGCKSLPLLKLHKRSHSKSSSLVCKVCFRSFASFHCLKEHTQSHTSVGLNRAGKDRSLNSSVGQKKIFPGTEDLLQQVVKLKSAKGEEVSEDMKELKCEDCHRRFNSSRHLISHRCMSADTYICGVCNMTFSSICKLKIHLKIHSTIIKCDICDILFCEETELEEHNQEEHSSTAYPEEEVDEFVCTLCYESFENASGLQDHMKDHVPTMLFSGKSLGEDKTELMLKKAERTNSSSVLNVEGKVEVVSDSGDERVSKRAEKREVTKHSGSDDESILDSNNFYEIVNLALAGSDHEDNEEGGSDHKGNEEGGSDVSDTSLSDTDEMYSGIKTALENDVLDSDESDLNELEELNVFRKPLLYNLKDIMNTHHAEFERYSERDATSHIFKCTLCCTVFNTDKCLNTHLKKHHVCEFCNVFFNDTEILATHKFHHEKQLLSQIKAETNRLCLSKKWNRFNRKQFSKRKSEIKRINGGKIKSKQSQADIDAIFLVPLSHSEMLNANRHNFENFSCSDSVTNICKICWKEYARATTLTRHMKTHVCEFCGKFFEDKFDLSEHRYSHRNQAALIRAEITGKDTTLPPRPVVSKPNRVKFKKYSFIDVSRNIYQCMLCQKNFVRRTVLNRHLKTHICLRCDEFYEDKTELAKHYSHHTSGEHGPVEVTVSSIGMEEKLPVSSSGTEKKLPASSNGMKVKLPVSSSGTEKKSHVSSIGMGGKSHVSSIGMEEKLPVSSSGTEQKLPALSIGMKVKLHVSSSATERKLPPSSNGMEEKSPASSNGMKVNLPVSSSCTEKKLPALSNGMKVKLPVSSSGTEKKSHVSSIALEGKLHVSSSATERQLPASSTGMEEKLHVSSIGMEEKLPVCNGGINKKFSVSNIVTVEKLPVSFIDMEGKLPDSNIGMEGMLPVSSTGLKGTLPVSSILDTNGRLNSRISLLSYTPQPGVSLVSQTQSSSSTMNNKALILHKVLTDDATSTEVMSIIPRSRMPSLQAISQPVQIFVNTAHLAAVSASFQDKTQRRKPLSQPLAGQRDRPFACGECGQKFLRSSHLTAHLTIHSEERPFPCSDCGKSFGRMAILQNHLRTHRKACRVCGCTFDFKYELDLHMAEHRTTFLS